MRPVTLYRNPITQRSSPIVIATLVLLAFAAGPASVVAAGPPPRGYAIFDVAGPTATALAINEHCQITGHARNGMVNEYAFLYSGGVLNFLSGVDPTCTSAGMDINDAGQIALQADFRITTFCDEGMHLWDAGVLTSIPPLSAGVQRDVFALNAFGEIAGRSYLTAPSGLYATLWLPAPAYGLSAGINNLGALPGDTWAEGYGINDRGEVVGYSMLPPGGNHRGFVWLPAAAYGLPAGINNIGGLGGAYTHATDINNVGQIVGDSVNTNGFTVAMLWENGVCTDLDTVGGAASFAHAINNLGDIVGMSDAGVPPPYQEAACIWYDGQYPPTDLNAFLPAGSPWILMHANDINDRGQIVGDGLYNMVLHAFLLTPIVDSDFDADGDVDTADYDHQAACMNGPGVPPPGGCSDADLDGDTDVDLDDYGMLQRCFSGTGVPALPGC